MQTLPKILLRANKGFKWTHKGQISFKGFLFSEERIYLTGEKAVLYLSGIKSAEELKQLLSKTDGLFAIAIQLPSSILLACDRVRTFPLFYSENFVTDDPVSMEDQFDINSEAEHEFLHAAFVAGKDTLLKNLFQVQSGEVIEISNAINSSFYYTYITSKWHDLSFNNAFDQLTEVLDSAFADLIVSLEGKPVAVSLSGGYDSRLIAMMLKKHNYPNVLCYTFGRKDNKELNNSRLTADKLGYPWVFIEYNLETTKGYLKSPEFVEYYKFAAKYTSMPFLQDYFAIKHLKENKLMSDDTIFLAGHVGDVIAGSRLKGRFSDKTKSKEILDLILNDNYHLGNSSFSQPLIDKLKTQINIQKGKPASIYENWDQKERQSKYTVNSTSA